MSAMQQRHVEDVTKFLNVLKAGNIKSVALPSPVTTSIKNIVKARGLAVVVGRGVGASWTITKEGKAFVAPEVAPTAEAA